MIIEWLLGEKAVSAIPAELKCETQWSFLYHKWKHSATYVSVFKLLYTITASVTRRRKDSIPSYIVFQNNFATNVSFVAMSVMVCDETLLRCLLGSDFLGFYCLKYFDFLSVKKNEFWNLFYQNTWNWMLCKHWRFYQNQWSFLYAYFRAHDISNWKLDFFTLFYFKTVEVKRWTNYTSI